MDVVFLCGRSLDEFQITVIDTFRAARSSQRIVGCVIDARPVPSLWQRTRKNLARGRGGYVAIMALNRVKGRLTAASDSDAEGLLGDLGVPIISTDDPDSEETLSQIRALRSEVLLLLGGFGILKAPLLGTTPQGVLSYHHGDMREYRGQPPTFWELYNGEERMGVTVQRLSPGIDCGEPIVEQSFAIRADDTQGSLSGRIFAGSTGMMLEAVRPARGSFVPARGARELGARVHAPKSPSVAPVPDPSRATGSRRANTASDAVALV